MKKNGVPREQAFHYKELLNEIRPNWNVIITDGDVNLYKLGFISYYPCNVEIDVSEEELDELDEEIFDMEVDAYAIDETLHAKSKWDLTEREKEILKIDREYMKRYEKFACLYRFWQ